MNTENKAMKEISDSIVLTDYLIHFDLDFDDINNFSSKMVKKAIAWKKGLDYEED